MKEAIHVAGRLFLRALEHVGIDSERGGHIGVANSDTTFMDTLARKHARRA